MITRNIVQWTAAALLTCVLLSTPAFARDFSEVSLTDCNTACFEASCNSTTDLACICDDPAGDGSNPDSAFWAIEYCMNSCLFSEWYIGQRILYEQCDVPRPFWTQGPRFVICAVVAFLVQTLFFVPRVLNRITGIAKWGWDDSTCLVAYIFLVGMVVLGVLEDHYSIWDSTWTLDLWKLPIGYKIDFAWSQLYSITLGICKASIICLYQRLFESGDTTRRVLWGTHVFNVLIVLAYFIPMFFVYRPLHCLWDSDLDIDGQCAYDTKWSGSGGHSALNAVLDIWLVALPAFIIWRLNMSQGKRLGVIVVFAAGILTVFVAILRFALFRVQARPDISQWSAQVMIWALYYAYYAELTSCFVIACLPATKQLVETKLWRNAKSLSSTKPSSNPTGSNQSKGRGHVRE